MQHPQIVQVLCSTGYETVKSIPSFNLMRRPTQASPRWAKPDQSKSNTITQISRPRQSWSHPR